MQRGLKELSRRRIPLLLTMSFVSMQRGLKVTDNGIYFVLNNTASQCKEDWKATVFILYDDLRTPGLNAKRIERTILFSSPTSLFSLCLNAKRIESHPNYRPQNHRKQSQCKEDWKLPLPSPPPSPHPESQCKEDWKFWITSWIMHSVAIVSMQRGLKVQLSDWDGRLGQGESQCKEDWKLGGRNIERLRKKGLNAKRIESLFPTSWTHRPTSPVSMQRGLKGYCCCARQGECFIVSMQRGLKDKKRGL